MLAIELSIEKTYEKFFWLLDFLFLTAINSFVFKWINLIHYWSAFNLLLYRILRQDRKQSKALHSAHTASLFFTSKTEAKVFVFMKISRARLLPPSAVSFLLLLEWNLNYQPYQFPNSYLRWHKTKKNAGT